LDYKSRCREKDKVASSIKSYISYLNSVSRIINEDLSKENLYNENCITTIISRINKIGVNIKSIPKYTTAMRQYVKMVNGSNNYTLKKSNTFIPKTFMSQIPNQISNPRKRQNINSKYNGVFKMPNAVTIMGRSSSITNSFINGIIPLIEPSEKDIEEVLSKNI